MQRFLKKAAAFAFITALSGCLSMGGGSFDDAEISSMAALGRMDEALAGPLFEGDGGKDLRLAVLAPELRGGGPGDEWLPGYAQGFLHTTLGKYSAMTLIDRQNLDRIIAEQDLAANGRFSDNDFVKIGGLTNAQHFLTGTVQKLPGGDFSLSLSITDSSTGESRASFMKDGSAAAVRDGSLLNEAAEQLLARMGVILTERGRRALSAGRYMAARAEAGYARGVAAEAGGEAVQALLNFSQAVAFDPSRLEALSRLGSVSSEISGNSVSANILNDLLARRAWLDAMKEAAAFFNDHPPFEISYDPALLQVGDTDYRKERADLAMRLHLAPSKAGFTALNALLEGLDKTGKRNTWGFSGWPLQHITPKTPEARLFDGKRNFSFTVEAGLVNEAGKVIARGKTTLKTGALTFTAGDTMVGTPEAVFGRMDFPKVDVANLTPTLTVVIAGVNGIGARQISETGYMRIAPADVARMEQELEQQRQREAAERQRQERERQQERQRQLAAQERQRQERERQRQLAVQERQRQERERQAAAEKQERERQIRLAASFALVEGGSFQMGSANGRLDETFVRTVTVKRFYLKKTEVTQQEWRDVMGTTVIQQRDMTEYKGDDGWLAGVGDMYPMYYVNWYEAVEYCNKRSVKEGLTPAYRGSGDSITCDFNANGYRLPTEAEWEYAAKGGGKDLLVFEYPGGNSLDAVAWYTVNSGRLNPVGGKRPNSLDLYDMGGNVWEWCWDWYGSYETAGQTNPTGPTAPTSWGLNRMFRGGSWISPVQELRSAYRAHNVPSLRGNAVGFRVARSRL